MFGMVFRDTWRRVMEFGETEGVLTKPPKNCTVECGPLKSRNDLEQAQALTLDVAQGLSRRTYLIRRDYDPDKEAAQRKAEAEEDYANNPAAQAAGNEDIEGDALKAKAQFGKAETKPEDSDEQKATDDAAKAKVPE